MPAVLPTRCILHVDLTPVKPLGKESSDLRKRTDPGRENGARPWSPSPENKPNRAP